MIGYYLRRSADMEEYLQDRTVQRADIRAYNEARFEPNGVRARLLARRKEDTGYDTQKPEALLERIIKASSNENDLVLDCFVGSGTTAVVAEKLNRRWIACDLSRFAIHTTRKRLLAVPNVRPFVVQNLGKYERQVWQSAQFGPQADGAQAKYRRFILDLYHARAIHGYTWLHGLRAGRMVHVGMVDAPVSMGDVTNIIAEFKRAIGTGKDAPTSNGVDVLGWDFAFEINEVAKHQAAQANVDLRFLRIPRDVMDKRAVEQGDITFFELAALSVDVAQHKRTVTLTLGDFVIPPDDVPEEVRPSIKHWSQGLTTGPWIGTTRTTRSTTSGRPIARARTPTWNCPSPTSTRWRATTRSWSQTFLKALRPLVVQELTPHLLGTGRKLSGTPPFPYSRPTLPATRTVFNLVACNNEFEKTFARFLEGAPDVARFAKLPEQFGFAIEYTDANNNLRYYEPDFVAVTTNGAHYLVETKGREDIDVASKDRAATLWCENATALTGTPWAYIKVPQKEYEALQPDEFADLAVFAPAQML